MPRYRAEVFLVDRRQDETLEFSLGGPKRYESWSLYARQVRVCAEELAWQRWPGAAIHVGTITDVASEVPIDGRKGRGCGAPGGEGNDGQENPGATGARPASGAHRGDR